MMRFFPNSHLKNVSHLIITYKVRHSVQAFSRKLKMVEVGGHDACRITLYLDKYSTHLIIQIRGLEL